MGPTWEKKSLLFLWKIKWCFVSNYLQMTKKYFWKVSANLDVDGFVWAHQMKILPFTLSFLQVLTVLQKKIQNIYWFTLEILTTKNPDIWLIKTILVEHLGYLFKNWEKKNFICFINECQFLFLNYQCTPKMTQRHL